MKLNQRKIFICSVIFLISISFLSTNLSNPHEIWDERARYVAGLDYLFNIAHGNFDSSSWQLNYFHPPIGKYLYGIVNGIYLYTKVSGLLSLSYNQAIQIVDQTMNLFPGRFLAITLGALSVVLTFLIGRDFMEEKMGIVSALFLLSFPVFVAHVTVENLESPLLFFLLLSIYTFFKALSDKKTNSKFYLISAIFAGLAIGTKFNNFILVFLLPAFYIYFNYKNFLKKKLVFFKQLPSYLILYPIIVLIIFFASWPWLWSNPIEHFKASLNWWTYLPQEYFLGNLTSAPLYYYIVYFFVTMPVLLILFFLTSLWKIKNENIFGKIFLIWFVLSLFVFLLTQFKQNGADYLFPLYPAFAFLVGMGFIRIYKTLSSNKIIIAQIFAILTTIYIVSTLIMIRPYYLDYYNELAGGPANVYNNKLFVIGYQGEGIGAAVDYLNSNAVYNSTIEFHVAPAHTQHNLRADLIEINPIVRPNETLMLSNVTVDQTFHNADYVVTNTYFEWYINNSFDKMLTSNFSYKLVKTIDVEGAPLVWIYKK